MKVIIELNTEKKEDVVVLSEIGKITTAVSELMLSSTPAAAEEPAQPEKPKRVRAKKAETPEPTPEPEVEKQEESPKAEPENTAGDLPFDNEVEEDTQSEPVAEESADEPADENAPEWEKRKAIVMSEWEVLFNEKFNELELKGVNSPYKMAFTAFVKNRCNAMFGIEMPKKLKPEQLYVFYKTVFKKVAVEDGKFYLKED